MKTRILILDNHPLAREQLGQKLEQARPEWRIQFARSAPEAFHLMDQTPFDLVVCGHSPPGLDGVQFLSAVMTRFPESVRFLLSDGLEPQMILRSAGAAHQCLIRPCEVEQLQDAMNRATMLDILHRNELLTQLISQLETIPTVPALYYELIRKSQNSNTPIEEIAALVERDPGISAKVLKLVNSAHFGLSRSISQISEAVGHLGLDLLNSLVLSLNAFSKFESAKLGGISLKTVWRHSLQTAEAARFIARQERASQAIRDASFTAGLLHDIGKLILASNFPEAYKEAASMTFLESLPLVKAEEKLFQASHAELGGYLLGLWGLPIPVVEAIIYHHNPGGGSSKTFSALTAVHVANALILQRESKSASAPDLDMVYLQELGLEQRLADWEAELNEFWSTPT